MKIKDGSPNPFLHDIEILINSVVLAVSSISMQGINANAIESIMRKACNPVPKNFKELLTRLEKMKKGSELGAAHESLILKIEQYSLNPVIDNFEIQKENIVFNFEGLANDSLRFWANVVMAVAYEKMQGGSNKDLTLVCDEAHAIVPSDEVVARHSIINEISRMGRAFGSYFVISQMMSDIPYFVRENCAMIFCFATHSALELGLVPDRLMRWTLQHLPQHTFIDLKVNYGTFVPIFKFCKAEAKIEETQTSDTAKDVSQEVIHVPEPEIEIIRKTRPEEADIIEALEKSEVSMYPRQLSNIQAEKLDLDKDKTSLYVSKLAYRMAREGKICLDVVEDYYEGKDKEWKLFCPVNSDLLHVWMVRRVVEEVRTRTSLQIQYVSEGIGNSGADVSTDFELEVETGKMNDDQNLMSRITNSKKNVVIIVPNSRVKAEYLTKNYPRPVEVLTLREFVKKLAMESSK